MDDVTLSGRVFLTRADQTLSSDDEGVRGAGTTELPHHLLQQAARRLQIVAMLVLVITFISWILVNALEGELIREFQQPADWIPATLGILFSVAIYLFAAHSRLRPMRIIQLGLVYEVCVAYCMAFGQYWNTFWGLSGERLTGDLVGASGVALWMAFFTVIVPSRPRNAIVALVLSASAVPVTILILIRMGDAPALSPMNFFFIFVLPYLITAGMCLVAANIIYGLGREVTRAQQMGSYHLQSMIGRGGMGEVWRARHNLLARPAAIKLIRRDALATDPGRQQAMITRFEQEAQVTAHLESPHTVDLYDFGVGDDGTLFYVMELLEGVDLDSMIRSFGPMPAERVVYVLRQVCTSLAEAHQRALVHRDIKPANVVLCQHALEYDFVKVLDFGLVKRLPSLDGEGGVHASRTDMVPGTPAFVAPEVATGADTVDGRADLYSLGCVAYWLLTGQPVFAADNPVAMIMAHTHSPVVRPSSRTELPIPTALDDLVVECLAKRPEERPESAVTLADRLGAVTRAHPWTRERAREWWMEHRPTDIGVGG